MKLGATYAIDPYFLKKWTIRVISLLKVLLLSSVLSTSAHAGSISIVDTGPGTGTAWTLHSNQWLAAEFTTSENYVLTDIFGSIFADIGGDLNISLYNGDEDIPGLKLFSTSVSIPKSTAPYTDPWQGASNLDWLVDAGTYWVAFEPEEGFSGVMPGSSRNALINEASHSFGAWGASNGLNIGVQIYGDSVSEVPIPGAVFLFGSALFGFIGTRRKLRKDT